MINSSCYFFLQVFFSSPLNTKLERNDNSLISDTVFPLNTEFQDIDPFVSHIGRKNISLENQTPVSYILHHFLVN